MIDGQVVSLSNYFMNKYFLMVNFLSHCN